jgi:hypothetical protein
LLLPQKEQLLAALLRALGAKAAERYGGTGGFCFEQWTFRPPFNKKTKEVVETKQSLYFIKVQLAT